MASGILNLNPPSLLLQKHFYRKLDCPIRYETSKILSDERVLILLDSYWPRTLVREYVHYRPVVVPSLPEPVNAPFSHSAMPRPRLFMVILRSLWRGVCFM
jgi:hypothetical protein